jgi:hypothetical protein
MSSLSARDIVRAWEAGRDRHPIDRALLLLSLARPDLTPAQLAALTVGQRNHWLLVLRRELLGPVLKGYAECPNCDQALEFEVDANAILRPEPAQATLATTLDGMDLHVRLPDSQDLAAVAGLDGMDAARRLLIERCLLAASRDGAPLDVDALPDTLLLALVDTMAEQDPQAETRLRLTCQACGHSWPALFDIASFLWTEIEAYAQRLLLEAHTLARAYGWSEGEVLALSSTRRKFYLDLVAP